MAKANTPFFFDIETGGFNKGKSSILSISFGHSPRSVESLYAEPALGSTVSRWSEKHVWEPIKGLRGVPIQTEESVLKNFLQTLQKLPEGQVVTGWNIGFAARPTGRGFDIPMLMARAERYGLQGEYREAFKRLSIRDIGQEYAYRMSKEVAKYGHLVEQGVLPNQLFESAKAYAELGAQYEAGRPASERQAARFLAEEFKNVAGWKQEVLYETLTGESYKAHLSKEDVKTGLRMAELFERGTVFQTEEDVLTWGRKAYERSLISQALTPAAGVYKGEPELPEEKFQRIMASAFEMERTGGKRYANFSSTVLEGINREVAERGGKFSDIVAGRGIAEDVGRVIRTKGPTAAEAFGLPTWARKVGAAAWKRKLPIGVGLGLVGLYAAQPLSWFSGKDDAYNTIEGLPHGGEAQRMRRMLTDFGSGFLRKLFRGTAKKIGEHTPVFGTSAGVKLTAAQDVAEKVLERVRVAEFASRPSRMASTFWTPSPREAASYATGLGQSGVVSSITAQEGTFYARQSLVTELNKEILARTGNKKRMVELARSYWKGVDPKKVATRELGDVEALIPQAVTTERAWTVHKQLRAGATLDRPSYQWSTVPGFDDAHNTIEGLGENGLASILRKKNTDFGSGFFRSLFAKAARPFTFAGRAERLYKKAIFQSLRAKGISTKGAQWSFVDIAEAGTLDVTMMVKSRTGQPLAMMSRSLSPGEVYLTSIEVGTKGGGLGKQIYAREAQVLRKLGYQTGTKVTSPIANPITARWQAQLYHSAPTRPHSSDFFEQLLNKRIAHDEFQTKYAGEFVGKLQPAPNQIVRKKVPQHEAMVAGMVRSNKRKAGWFRKHKESMVRASANAHNPGKRHINQTGKPVL